MPFRDGNGSRAALEGASREQRGAPREQGRAIEAQREYRGAWENTGRSKGTKV